jgi:DNA-directed RNA polymerase subunit RPC12/RpoP
MGLLVVALLGLGCAIIIGYPVWSGRSKPAPVSALADSEIEAAVRQLRQARSSEGLHCPQCDRKYVAGDQFCVRCGAQLPAVQPDPAGQVCPECGVSIQEGDQFCAKCGYSIVSKEAA